MRAAASGRLRAIVICCSGAGPLACQRAHVLCPARPIAAKIFEAHGNVRSHCRRCRVRQGPRRARRPLRRAAFAAFNNMRANRGGNGRARSRRPSAVMWPSASSASISCKPERAAASAPSPGGSSHASGADRSFPIRRNRAAARKVRRTNFRIGEGHEALRFRFLPKPVANARLRSPGAASALIGGCTRYAHGFEPRHANVRLEARDTRQAAVDDDPYALDRDRCLGDRRRKDDLAMAGLGRGNGAILGSGVERAVEWHDIDTVGRNAFAQAIRGACDFALAQEGRRGSSRCRLRSRAYGLDDIILDARCARRPR